MEGEVPEWVGETRTALEAIITKPKLTDKLLMKPPFRFLHDIVTNVMKNTGFGNGLFEESELNAENIQDKEAKMNFLNKILEGVSAAAGETLQVSSKNIVAGKEPQQTNTFLQTLAKVAIAHKNAQAPNPDNNDGSSESKPTKKRSKSKTKGEKGTGEKKTKAKGTKEGTKKAKTTKTKEGTAKATKATVAEPKESSSPVKVKKTTKTAAKKAAAKSTSSEAPPPAAAPEPEPAPVAPPPEPQPEVVQKPPEVQRPQTARAPPPRVQSNVRTVPRTELEAKVNIGPAVGLIEEGTKEEEEDSTMAEEEEEAGSENRTDITADGLNSLDSEQHGGLVRDILAANKSLEDTQRSSVEVKKSKVELLSNKHRKEVLQKEVSEIREYIQVICRNVNPLGKTIDYVQEDFENMSREYDKWKQEVAVQQSLLLDEQRTTEQQLAPLRQQLNDLNTAIRDLILNINSTKNVIAKNDEHISKMLRMVVHH